MLLLKNNNGAVPDCKTSAQIDKQPAAKIKQASQLVMGLLIAANALLISPVVEAAKPSVSIKKVASINEGGAVTLDASASKDRDGDTLTYAWVQTKGTTVALVNPNAAIARFTAPAIAKTKQVTKPAKLTFQVTVSDGKGASKKIVDVTIKPVNALPVANAGADHQVPWDAAKSGIALDGLASSDDGQLVSYQWTLLTKISKKTKVRVISPKSTKASFTLSTTDQSKAIPLDFRLTVTDNDKKKSTDTVRVTVSDALPLPVSNAGADQTVSSGATVNLDGGQSTGTIENYAWSQTEGNPVKLSTETAVATSFTAPIVTTPQVFTFKLTTGNGSGSSDDTVRITVNPAGVPVANAGSDQTVAAGALVNLNGSQSTGNITAYAWIQTAGPSVVLNTANTVTASFTAPSVAVPTVLSFKLTASYTNGSATDSVDITVNPLAQSADILGTLSLEAPEVEINDPVKAIIKDLSGGTKPYSITTDWGDGKTETIKLADDANSYEVEHYYPEEKSYTVKMTVVDAKNQSKDFTTAATIATLAQCSK